MTAGLSDDTPAAAAIAHSVPPWLSELWWEELGAAEARALLARVNEPAESAVRANTLIEDTDAVAAGLPGSPARDPDLPEALVLSEPFDAYGSQLWRDGALMPQSRASMLVARVVDPQPGERILDLCSAPGAKTTHLAALMGDAGEIIAVERHGGRAQALERTCLRMHATSVTVQQADAARLQAGGEPFDRVLLDPPCSGLGTLQSRPDLRWRASLEKAANVADEQAALLDAAAQAVAPGGTMVYSTCTLRSAENERQIERFLARHDDFSAIDAGSEFPKWEHPHVPGQLLALPHRHHTDGFFIARLRRAGGRARRNERRLEG